MVYLEQNGDCPGLSKALFMAFFLHGLSSEKFHENPNDAIIVARRAHVGVLLVRRRVAKGIQVIPEDFGKANPA